MVVIFVSIATGCKNGTQTTLDWPQYLGPYRNSTSDQKGLLRSWPEKGPEVLWTVNVGIGYGGPVINDGKVYLLDRNGEAGDIMRCFNFSNGKELWSFSYDAPGTVQFPGSRSVPTLDGNYIYSCSQNGDLYCIDIRTHKPVWNKNIWTDYGGERLPNWECHIPVPSAVDAGEGRVLVAAGYELGTVMLKVEKKTDGSYGVTELFRHNDFGDQTKPPVMHNGYFYAQFSTNSKKDGLACMNMNGKVLWKTQRKPGFDKGSMILADGLILATDGSKTLYLIDPDTTGFKPLASAELLGEGGAGSENDPVASRVGGTTQNWGPLALADGRLLIRDQNRMMCVRVVK